MLALGAVLGCGPAHGGDSTKVNVSAVILPRMTCKVVVPDGSRVPTASARACTSNAATTYRIRRSTDKRADEAHAAPKGHAGTVVLSIEP